MSQLQVTGEAKIRDIQGPVVANDGVITALDGAANQYVRGDGTLANFPTSGGGGSSVSYYLNGSVNQGTFGGSTYYQMSKNAITGVGTNFSASANGLIAQFITDANDPDVVSIPSGNWNVEFFMNVSASSGALASFYVEIYKYDGSTFTLLATNVATPEQLTNTTTVDAYFTSVAMPLSSMAITDRLAIRIFVNVASKTVTLYTENNRLCQVVTTFSNGLTSLNNLTDQSQYLTTGTSGTNFAIVSSGDTHTFNLPVASASNTGKLSSTDWSTFNNKVPYTGATAALDMGNNSITTSNYIFGKAIELDAGVEEVGGRVIFRQRAATSGGGANYTTFGAQSNNNVNFSFWQDAPSGINRYKFFTFSVDNLTLNLNRTYQMPDASGTLALTSNLSAYVPYTGATANLDLGTNGLIAGAISSSGIIVANGLLGALGGLDFQKGNTPSLFTLGDVILYSEATTNNVVFRDNASKAKLEFNNSTQTYTFPAITGTLALLEGSQTFSGTKFFSTALYAERGIVLTAGVITFLAGSTSLNGNANGLTIGLGVTVGGTTTTYAHQLLFPQITPRTYTFPAASGTVALTSDLSAYLPLTGGTLTGALSGTSASFSGIVSSIVSSGGTSFRVVNADNSRTWSLIPSTNAAESDLWLYYGGTGAGTKVSFVNNGNVLIGSTTDNGSRLQVTGAATFSSSVTAGGATAIADALLPIQINAATSSQAYFASNNNGGYGLLMGYDNANGYARIRNVSNTALTFETNNTERMRITAAGNVGIGTSLPISFGNTFNNLTTSGSTGSFVLTTNSGNTIIGQVGVDDTLVYYGSRTNHPVTFSTNTIERMRINTSGNVGIGTSNPIRLLSLGSSFGASGGLSTNIKLAVYDNGTSGDTYGLGISGGMFEIQSAENIGFYNGTGTTRTERMRITSGGNVLIGTTSVTSQGTLNSYTNNANPAGRFISGPSTPDGNIVLMVDKFSSTNTTSQWFLGFTISNQTVASGVITANGASQAAFGSWSDRRLKENIIDLEPQLHKILALRPVEFDYIKSEGGGHQISFIAQEFEEVYPDAVGERQDGMKTLTGWSKTEARLVKAIQEQQAQIEELKAKTNRLFRDHYGEQIIN